MARVKENTLRKVEDFFVKEAALRGNRLIQVRLDDLKRETKLSLVTLYKALDDLVILGKLEIIEGSSRRAPKTYRYLGNLEPVDLQAPINGDFGGLSKVLEDMMRQIQVKDDVINTLRERLSRLEEREKNVMYRLKLGEGTEITVTRGISQAD